MTPINSLRFPLIELYVLSNVLVTLSLMDELPVAPRRLLVPNDTITILSDLIIVYVTDLLK
jgi:hypothetical protein